MHFTSYSNSPAIFRKWVALTVLGSAMQRKTWILIQGEPMFCNLFTVLVGPPGVGKTRAIRMGTKLLATLPDFALSANSITREKFLDKVAGSLKMNSFPDGRIESQTAFACYLDELSSFIRANDLDFMTMLTDLYDSPKVWLYETLSRGTTRIENLHLSLCGGITPKAIQRNWGEGAIGLGFTARLNMVYSEESKPIDLFGVREEPDFTPFAKDLKSIWELGGPFLTTPEAAKLLQEWVSAGMPPIPSDSRFAEYNPRRSIHWLKLCMLYCVAESNDLIIRPQHIEQAKETLLEMEAMLPLAFEHMGANPMLAAINSLHQWLKVEYAISKKALPEFRVRRKLMADVPPQYVDASISELINSGMVTVQPQPNGTRSFIPILTRRTD